MSQGEKCTRGDRYVGIYSDPNTSNCGESVPKYMHNCSSYIQSVAHAKENVKFLSPT